MGPPVIPPYVCPKLPSPSPSEFCAMVQDGRALDVVQLASLGSLDDLLRAARIRLEADYGPENPWGEVAEASLADASLESLWQRCLDLRRRGRQSGRAHGG